MSQELDALYDGIDAAESPGGHTPRLAVGTHTVVIDGYRGKPSKKAMGTILEADFLVETSTIHAPGERRGWPFYPQAPGWMGVYEKDRIKGFYQSVDGGLGIPGRPAKETGAALASGQLRGLKVQVTVEPVFADDGQPRRDKKGRPITNAIFSPVRQTAAEMQAKAATMPPIVQRQQAVQQQGYAQPQQAAPQYQQPTQPYPAQPQYQAQPQGMQPYPQQPPQGYPQQGAAPQGYPQYPQQPQGQPGYPPGVGPQPQAQPGAPVAAPPGFLAGLRNGNGQ